eukprot:COSAG02_NODE_179_length_31090_cov_49.813785_38_plen_569_part_00
MHISGWRQPPLWLQTSLLLHMLWRPSGAQLLHHSSSPYGPWEPVVPEGCNASTGIWRDGGGNNQSPFYITEAVSRLTGLQVDSLVAITTHNNSFFAIGIAKNWTSPMVQQEQPPRFENPQTIAWEDPYIYFDLRRKIWRVLYHEVPGKASPGFQPVLGIHKHCGGYAESRTPDIWGDWVLSPPQCGAYTLDVDAFVGLESRAEVQEATGTGPSLAQHRYGDAKVGGTTCVMSALRGCFQDDNCSTGGCPNPLLPHYQAQLHDKVTLGACALACHALSSTIAGIDAGNHCFCGSDSDLSTATARSQSRSLAECEVVPCHAAPSEKCGGVGRLLAYNFSCSSTPTPPSPPPRPHPGPVAPQCDRTAFKPPFKFGKSYPAFASENLTSWGGNAVEGDDGKYHMFTSAMSNGKNGNAAPSDLIPGPCSVGTWERNSLVVHAVAQQPTGPYKFSDVAMGSAHTNPQIMRTPSGHWLLFSQATCATNQYEHVCTGCHKGMCGPQKCDPPSHFPPLPRGNLSLSRRERPKMLFDKAGTPTHLFNSADPGGTATPPNPGWQRNSRPFTMVTEILES